MTTVERPSWDEYFMRLAELAATRSTCSRLAVGAVLVRPNHRVISTGYNGVPAGEPHCVHTDNERCQRAVHAEINAISFGPHWLPAGLTLYVTHSPCADCQRSISMFGVARLVFGQHYGSANLEGLRQRGVAVEQLSTKERRGSASIGCPDLHPMLGVPCEWGYAHPGPHKVGASAWYSGVGTEREITNG